MKTDIYTKTVLTVIAVCLVILALRPVTETGLVGRAYAADAPAAPKTPAPMDVRIVAVSTNLAGIPVFQEKNRDWPVQLAPVGGASELPPVPVYAVRPFPTFLQVPQP